MFIHIYLKVAIYKGTRVAVKKCNKDIVHLTRDDLIELKVVSIRSLRMFSNDPLDISNCVIVLWRSYQNGKTQLQNGLASSKCKYYDFTFSAFLFLLRD